MSFYAPYVMKAVRDRLVGDSTLAGLLTGSDVYIDYAAASPTPPYIVIEWVTATPEEGFSLRRHNLFIDLHLYLAAEPSDGTAPQAVEASILDRVHGDWDEQATRVPTYGLERWQPTLAGGAGSWVCTHMRLLEHRRVPNGDDGFLQWDLSFQVDVQKGIG